jgi:hypothetical protein
VAIVAPPTNKAAAQSIRQNEIAAPDLMEAAGGDLDAYMLAELEPSR